MDALAPPKAAVTWTYSDLRSIPDDGKRYEIIDGELIVTPSPSTVHQTVSKRIQFLLMQQVEHTGQGAVFSAPLDVIFSATRTVVPDLLVVSASRRGIITERGVEGAPDLVFEILSPSTRSLDLQAKRKLYASEGVREYWLADPEAHTLELLVLGPDGYESHGIAGPGQRLRSTIFELDLEIDPVFA
jgi:Uma2 family endonuclease